MHTAMLVLAQASGINRISPMARRECIAIGFALGYVAALVTVGLFVWARGYTPTPEDEEIDQAMQP